ncbi:glycoside hydrolase family 97 protein [Sphingobacterium sp. LRF_L2]|uniref:glycoside hydrolase family 97 protein n=1 Tax=Sphingobacterium sp. LRF_L2 TaxID=3369421 RepID=UPI003F5FD93C
MKNLVLTAILSSLAISLWGQKKQQLKSPDGKFEISISLDQDIRYTVIHESDTVLLPSIIAMELKNGIFWGKGSTFQKAKAKTVKEEIVSPFYKRNKITDYYNELSLFFKEDFCLVFRAYNEGVAYRFVSTGEEDLIVRNEHAIFNFTKNFPVHIPYVKGVFNTIESQYFNSFENEYTYTSLAQIDTNKLAFTPLLIHINNGKKVCLAESDLENYPGMYLRNRDGSPALQSDFAPSPKTTVQGGHNDLQQLVTSRHSYIAKCPGKTKFPWRIILVSTMDKELADSDLIYKLASPSRLSDISWIKPGKVAWEWWNHWGISHVDFETGINNNTYKAYIDFASKNGIAYVILDEGWAVNRQADLFQVVPEIDLKELIAYGASKNVDLILWAGYYAFERDMERVCKHYAAMGIKGFKIDFMDRDDQEMVNFHYKAADIASKYKLLLDFHGTYKPTGINRTFPNVINFEAVHGLEQMKWTGIELDQVTYDVTMPFIRMIAGPVDYTQGAMRNASKKAYRGINEEPMSQGTRCRQLAEYVVFESPLNMLCDNPTNYTNEQQCTDFIAAIPTVWDQTIALDGEVGKYIAIAREKNDIWYVGAMTNWDARSLELDLSFLDDEGNYMVELYHDGKNASRIASDYRRENLPVPASRKIQVNMASGGGVAMKIFKI